jgi:putative Mg2+ transporter-C (MgtC) family protein
MASCALVAITGHVPVWFGSSQGSWVTADVSRTVQGVITGIGFLGAGVIHRDKYQTNGLTTAASLWAAAVIGVVVGVGLYAAAILLAALCIGCMALISSIERILPLKSDLFIKLRFVSGHMPTAEKIQVLASQRGYTVAAGTITVSYASKQPEWSFVMSSKRKTSVSVSDLAAALAEYNGIDSFEIAHVRN